MIQATFHSKVQNWENQSTTYWFTLNGADYGLDFFENDILGIVHCEGQESVVNRDGIPIDHTWTTQIILKICEVTDEMIYA